MTLSLLARDLATGELGMIVASSSPAVASRCLHVRAGVGVVASQNVTNPALGPVALSALAAGSSAKAALAAALAGEAHPEHRQVAVLDATGASCVHSGERTLGVHAALAVEGAAAAGNLLASPDVVAALLDGLASSGAGGLAERLLDALDAALAAGGEAGPVRSAGLAVVEGPGPGGASPQASWPLTDLRVDWHDDPARALRHLWQMWAPHAADYRTRALDPTAAPSYGVPGDE